MAVFVGVEGSSDGEKSRLEMETKKFVEDAQKKGALIIERAKKHAKNIRGRVQYQKRCQAIHT